MKFVTVPVGFDINKQPGFLYLIGTPLKPRIWLFFLTKKQGCPLVEDDKRVSERESYVEQSQKGELSSNVIT